MDTKIQKIMNKINVSSDRLYEFKNAKLESNKVDDLENTVDIKIRNEDEE